jgi:hypothetical protein
MLRACITMTTPTLPPADRCSCSMTRHQEPAPLTVSCTVIQSFLQAFAYLHGCEPD